MSNLIYSYLTSLDGYVADRDGNFDWAVPDEEVHGFINELEHAPLRAPDVRDDGRLGDRPDPRRSVTLPCAPSPSSGAADKVVHSATLDTASTARTRIEREFDPEAIRRMKHGP